MPPLVLVVMGVSGSGKTTLARAVAARLHWPFEEGDSLHPPENVAKMRAGHPLTDADRWPWLDRVAAWIDGRLAADGTGVVTCSALRRVYRERLIGARAGVRLVYLQGTREVIGARLAARRGHFMPASLLDSQFATLEEPGEDEHPLILDVAAPLMQATEAVACALSRCKTNAGD